MTKESLEMTEEEKLFYRFEKGVGFIGVEDFVAVHYGYEVFGVGKIDYVVRVAREHVYGLNMVAVDLPFEYLSFGVVEAALLDETVALDHYELLELGVVPVLALGDAGLADVDAHLAGIEGMDKLSEGTAGVDVHPKREGRLLIGQIAQICTEQLLGEGICRNFRNHQCFGLLCEGFEQIDNLSEGSLMRCRNVAILAVGFRKDFQAVEFAAVLLVLEGGEHFIYEVVDVQELELDRRVVDRVGKVIGKSVAEGCNGRIIIRPAPFAEEVRETIYQNLCSGLGSILEEEVLPCFLAASVLGVTEAAGERCLLRAGEHHRAGVTVLFKGVEQSGGEAEVAGHELGRILGTIDAGEVEHEAGLGAPGIELFRSGIEVVLENLIDCQARMCLVLAVTYVLKRPAKVLAYEAFCACY